MRMISWINILNQEIEDITVYIKEKLKNDDYITTENCLS